jgi:hypothetical protein
MAKAYDPKARNNDLQVEYMVNTAGDRWFVPYNNNDTTANQVTRCGVMCGNTTDGSACGSSVVA